MTKFCEGCGHPMEDDKLFCDKCGRKVSRVTPPPARPAAPVMRPQPPAQPAPVAAYAPPPQQKSRAGLFIALGIAAVAIIVLVIAFGGGLYYWVFARNPGGTANPNATSAPSSVSLIPFPDSLKVTDDVKVNCEYKSPDSIIPANYRSLDNIVFMQCWTDKGSTQLMVTVEIPGFTQKYQQLVNVTRAETELSIHPPMLADAAKTLTSSKDAELVVSVTDQNTNKVILQDTKPVKLYSRNDIQWEGADGTPYDENILAWVTPEAAQVDKLLRDSADALSLFSNGGFDSIVGYQKIGDLSQADGTYWQVAAMMYTLANKYKVKYIMAPFSPTGSDLQSVKTPAQVINEKAGLCVETAVTMASAIERTNMHAVLILLPGHAQVAVETWPNSGEYLLIETTALDAASNADFDKGGVITYMTKDQWTKYMAQDGYVAIDCDLAEKLHIQSID